MPTKTIHTPDGPVQFPDDMSDDAIADVLRGQYGGGGQKQASAIAQAKRAPQVPETTFKPDAGDMFIRGATGGVSDYVGAAGAYIGDRIANAIKPGDQEGISYENALQDMRKGAENYREENPVAGYGGEIAGAITSPIFRGAANLVDKGVNAATRASAPAARFMAQGPGRFLGFGLQGGAQGLVGGIGNAQNEKGGVPTVGDVAKSAGAGAAGGAVLGAVVPAAGEFAVKAIGSSAQKVQAGAPKMTQDQIRAASKAAYKASEDAGVIVKPDAFKQFVDDLPASLEGFRPRVAPKANDVIEALREESALGNPVTLETLDELRQVVSGAAKTMDRNEVRLISSIVEKMDDFIDGLGPANLVAGDAGQAVPALKEARSLWRTNAKLRNINDIVEIGENLNDPNWVKNQFRAIVRKPKMFNQYTADEQKILKEVARTGSVEWLARMLPLRGVQTAAPIVSEIGQGRNVTALQDLIARGGKLPPSRKLSPMASALLGTSAAPAASPLASALMTGGSNQ